MPELVIEHNPVEKDSSALCYPRKQDSFNIPSSHEERLEWVRTSCERFFEKVREFDALVALPELN